jgi:hypothetical protein
MMIQRTRPALALALAVAAATLGAQQAPPVRDVRPSEHMSKELLLSVSTVVPVSDGLLVNDIIAHRIVLFDSTLAHGLVIADSTSATGRTYGIHDGSLIAYRGDSALFIDPGSASMLVIGPGGRIARSIPVPRPSDIVAFTGGPFGAPGFDARGRLVYFAAAGSLGVPSIGQGQLITSPGLARLAGQPRPDSALVSAWT